MEGLRQHDRGEEPGFRAVLDASAMVSYARGHIHVGELITDIGDEQALVAVPSVTLLDAFCRVGGNMQLRDLLGLLIALPAVGVVTLGANDVAAVSKAVQQVDGDLGRGHAVQAAMRHRAYFVTAEPQLVPSIIDEYLVIEVPSADA